MHVEALDAAPPDWDAYVSRHAHATAYHQAAAVAIGAHAFRLRTTYAVARGGDGAIAGILPLVEQSSALFGRFLVSLPFVTYGGILADGSKAAAALVALACGLARGRRADHVELRHTEPLPGLGLAERRDKVSMVLTLPRDEQALAAQLGSKLRSQIRRAERESLELLWGGEERLGDFYHVFAPAMHELGTPVYSRRFFEIAYDALRDRSSILAVRMRGAIRAAAILVRHGNAIEVPWAVADPEAKRAAVNMRMYWELLRFALTAGAAEFDFGRSSVGSGTYRFKAQWGARERQLCWHYWLPAGAAIPKLNHSNPRYARAAALWRRMPLWCANTLGPHIVRHLP
jgi:FemAB-related protein (PEP-CTERM system-associated)